MIKKKWHRVNYNKTFIFGTDASIAIKDLPYLKVGPFHTNTVAGLQLQDGFAKKKEPTYKLRDYGKFKVVKRWKLLYE
jgi:hypothetical protein